MQQKVIKIPFDPNYFLSSHKAIWAFSNNKKVRPNIIYTALSIFCLAVGLTLEKKGDFPISTIFGGGYLFYMILIWIGFFERKTKFFNRTKRHAAHFEKNSIDSTYIFSENGFEYIDNEKSFRLSWFLFKPFVIYRDNVLLSLKDGGVSFAISRNELDEEDYSELCNILKEKTG